MKQTVLVVDDEVGILKAVEERLKLENFTVLTCVSAEQALMTVKSSVPDVMVVDVRLPGISGFDFCRKIRAMEGPVSVVPIIFLTTVTDETHRVLGLELGGDDYMCKPFSSAELVARIRALLRRSRTSEPVSEVLTSGSLKLDKEARKATLAKKELDLPPKAFDLLYVLVKKSGKVLTRSYLMQNVWNSAAETSSRTIDTHIKQLRQILGPAGKNIKTVEGLGYKWEDS